MRRRHIKKLPRDPEWLSAKIMGRREACMKQAGHQKKIRTRRGDGVDCHQIECARFLNGKFTLGCLVESMHPGQDPMTMPSQVVVNVPLQRRPLQRRMVNGKVSAQLTRGLCRHHFGHARSMAMQPRDRGLPQRDHKAESRRNRECETTFARPETVTRVHWIVSLLLPAPSPRPCGQRVGVRESVFPSSN